MTVGKIIAYIMLATAAGSLFFVATGAHTGWGYLVFLGVLVCVALALLAFNKPQDGRDRRDGNWSKGD